MQALFEKYKTSNKVNKMTKSMKDSELVKLIYFFTKRWPFGCTCCCVFVISIIYLYLYMHITTSLSICYLLCCVELYTSCVRTSRQGVRAGLTTAARASIMCWR